MPQQPRKRNPKPKTTVYSVAVFPGQTRKIVVRGRKKPRKLRQWQIGAFNKLVKSGLIRKAFFNESGALVNADFSRPPTAEEGETIKMLVDISSEPLLRRGKNAKTAPGYIAEFFRLDSLAKSNSAFKQHALRGGFAPLHPSFEEHILSGHNAMNLVQNIEHMNGREFASLHDLARRFHSRAEVEKNLRIQLQYFRELLLKRKQREIVVFRDESEYDSVLTRVRLTRAGVEKETTAKLKKEPFLDTLATFTVTLTPAGKIVHSSKTETLHS